MSLLPNMGAKRDWDLFVLTAQYAINVKVSKCHGSTPFSLMFARSANGFLDYSASQDLTATFDAEGYIKKLEEFSKAVFPTIKQKTQDYIDTMNKGANNLTDRSRDFPPGAFVMVTNKNKARAMSMSAELSSGLILG